MFIFTVIVTSYFLIAAMVAIGVVGFNPGAIRPMLRAPKHTVRLLLSRRMRRNHALEHATINIIEQRYRRSSLTGMPAEDGFHLRGRVSPHVITTATQEALRRLRRGERQLAYSRRCPTSLVATQVILLVLFLGIAVLIHQQFYAPTFLVAVLAAALLGPPLSPYLQRFALVDPETSILSIRDVEFEEPQGRLGLLSFVVLSPVFVRTTMSRGSGRYGSDGDGEVTLITGSQEEIPVGRYRLRE